MRTFHVRTQGCTTRRASGDFWCRGEGCHSRLTADWRLAKHLRRQTGNMFVTENSGFRAMGRDQRLHVRQPSVDRRVGRMSAERLERLYSTTVLLNSHGCYSYNSHGRQRYHDTKCILPLSLSIYRSSTPTPKYAVLFVSLPSPS